MKVILLSDVKKVGKKGEIVEVSDGYGRNFLLNKKLAVLATKKSMEILDEQNLQHVSTKQIVEQLQRVHAIKIEKRKFIDTDAITSLGYTDVKVDLYKNKVIGVIRVHVNG